MNWLEITVQTAASNIEDVAARLTAGGFSDLVIEDQAEFEDFLQENRREEVCGKEDCCQEDYHP